MRKMTRRSDTIYIIGNGPSLNRIDMRRLKGKETISFNRAYIAYSDWGFYPKYYMVVDPVVLENIKENVRDLIERSPVEKVLLPEWSRKYFGNNEKIIYLNFRGSWLFKRRIWGKNLNRLSVIANVGATSIPALKILGYRNFVILGTDCNYVEENIKNVEVEYNPDDRAGRKIVFKSSGDDDPNHFRPDYFGKGTEYSKPQQTNHYRGWEFIAKNMKKQKANIILCSPGSRLSSLFPEGDFDEVVRRY